MSWVNPSWAPRLLVFLEIQIGWRGFNLTHLPGKATFKKKLGLRCSKTTQCEVK